ncbi:MAG: site-specific DNA-methyltransferase [Chloroflexi bacterium]|nr:site-specific DNA-methyltransferase [Chloroflexota bacterium]
MPRRPRKPIEVTATTHDDSRPNIPTAEYQPILTDEERSPVQVAYARRNRDLDPQLVWRGKDEQDLDDLTVPAPPLFIQEKVHPKVLIDDLMRLSKSEQTPDEYQIDLFADFNGLPDADARTEFYQHEQNWSNRMILGDSLQVMASLAEREGLRGKVQCIYIDPPYGIRFNSNFQWSTTSRDVKDGNRSHITREPEQVKAFRDTWRDGIHSYLSYLRDRITVARDLLTESGSLFLQIGDENLHRVRALLDEVFGEDNFVITIPFQKKAYQDALSLSPVNDYVLWVAKKREAMKFRPLFSPTPFEGDVGKYSRIESPSLRIERSVTKNYEELTSLIEQDWRLVREDYPVHSQDPPSTPQPLEFRGITYEPPPGRHWSQRWPDGMQRLARAGRLRGTASRLYAREYWTDSAIVPLNNLWTQLKGPANPIYVVETTTTVIERCVLMSTDPGDLVLDPTCGAGTTAHAAENWGRRWITVDTSRVALALARARIMGTRYPYYLLADSLEGQQKEAELSRREPSDVPTYGSIRQGFVYERVPHITLRDIAINAEIDTIWDDFQQTLELLRTELNAALGESWEEWELPRDAGDGWNAAAKKLYAEWWKARIARQREIDASIAANANFEYLYDKPFEARRKARVAGPFTVESVSPHRTLEVDENDELIDRIAEGRNGYGDEYDFAQVMLENLKTSGVQQAHKDDRIEFASITPWPGVLVCAEGNLQGGQRAGIFVGPEFGTVSRANLVEAAREAAECGFDMLIACAFNYDAHSTELERLGRIPVLKARMNADLHMATDLKNTGKGNLFVIFGEPDIDIIEADEGDSASRQVKVKVNGVDVFVPNAGEIRSDGPEGIACWFIDTNYNGESFFVRHAYFPGATSDPYKALKTTLKAEIDTEAWATLKSDISRPFDKPDSGRIAVKVINHLGDEVMKVFRVE